VPATRSIVLAVCLMAAAPAAAHQGARPGAPARDTALSAAPPLPVIKPAPDFSLLDTGGRPVRLADLRGRVVLLSFIYTRCTDACPLLTARMARLQKRLGPGGAESVRLLTVTVDPERDTRDVLLDYARRFGAELGGWQFLRAEAAALEPMLSAYDEWRRPAAGGAIDHPARLYLIDRAGRIREIYALGFFDERQALADIRALLRERP
jgi:protein SCO1/2